MAKFHSLKVYNNFLDQSDYDRLYENLYIQDFPWYYVSTQSYPEDTGDIFDTHLTHVVYEKALEHSSNFREIFDSLVEKTTHCVYGAFLPDRILRVKCNLLLAQHEQTMSAWHTDYSADDIALPYFNSPLTQGKGTTAIYYLNTNNGYTEFKEDGKISSEENKLIIFDTKKEHRAVRQTDTKSRIVVNINFM
mgnify:CR=1 FL=1